MSPERANLFEGRAKRQALRVSRKIVVIALLLSVCMWAFIVWSLWSEYSAAYVAGRTEGYNLTAAFASELTMTFDSANAALRIIDSDIEQARPGASGLERLPDSVAAVAGSNAAVRIAAPDGHLLYSTLSPDAGPADFSHQAHFIAHRDDPKSGSIIDPPPVGAGNRTIEISRRLQTASGVFAGEAMLLLPPGSLITLNREIDLGHRGMIVIAGSDGIVRAGFDRAHVDGQIGLGSDLHNPPFPENLEPGGTAVFVRRTPLDGVERLVTLRELDRYPLRVLVALDLDDVVGPARRHIRLIGLVGLGASALFAILTVLLVREVWRRTSREIELAFDRDRLVAAQIQLDVERTRLADTHRELVASKERAEGANRTKSQFLAHMSHELRTPLHAIIGFSELIRDQAPTKQGSPPIGGYAADILTSGRHLLDLINTILDITKIESGTATLKEGLFPFADMTRNALVSVRGQADARNIKLDLRLPETPLRLFADRTRMLQVMINLLSNAVKFTPDDGEIVISVGFNPAGDVIISVIDSGIGMSDAEIMVAFEPFGQVDNALSRTFEGTGLGLPLASRLVELHGGRLELTSIKGRGTAARITLPAWRVAKAPATAS